MIPPTMNTNTCEQKTSDWGYYVEENETVVATECDAALPRARHSSARSKHLPAPLARGDVLGTSMALGATPGEFFSGP